MVPKLEQFISRLDSLRCKPCLADLAAAVSRVEISCDDVAPWILFSERGYTRNLVHDGLEYHLLVLCWKNGQRSPIHDHAGSCCCVRVLRGTLTETRFVFAPNGHVKAVESRDYSAGAVVVSEDMDLHQVSNLQAGSADLVTMHVYAPPLRFMGTYSLTDLSRAQEPMLIDFSEAAGI